MKHVRNTKEKNYSQVPESAEMQARGWSGKAEYTAVSGDRLVAAKEQGWEAALPALGGQQCLVCPLVKSNSFLVFK